VAPGETVLVIGGGPIGLLYLMVFKAAGAFLVIGSESAEQRACWARELGADAVIDPLSTDVPAAVRDLSTRRGADVVVDAVGSSFVKRSWPPTDGPGIYVRPQ
jgi:threonine dehydrogenase-like Zn-dependent dehydrogenase